MVRHKKLVVLTGVLLLFSLSVSAIEFKVSVSNLVDQNQVDLNFKENTTKTQRLSTTIENTGSIGCEYRLRTIFEEDEKYVKWSEAKGLWPGESKLFDLTHIPTNFTGEAEASVDITYCGQEEDIANFSYEVLKNNTLETNIDSKTLEVNSSGAKASLNISKGMMIPKKAPSQWKLSKSNIKQGEVFLKYDPTLFTEQRKISYAIIDEEGNLEGRTTIDLSEEPPLVYKLRKNVKNILLLSSLAVNTLMIILLGRRKLKNW